MSLKIPIDFTSFYRVKYYYYRKITTVTLRIRNSRAKKQVGDISILSPKFLEQLHRSTSCPRSYLMLRCSSPKRIPVLSSPCPFFLIEQRRNNVKNVRWPLLSTRTPAPLPRPRRRTNGADAYLRIGEKNNTMNRE